MITGDQMQTAGQSVFRAMAEHVAGTRCQLAGALRVRQQPLERNAAQADHDAQVAQQADLLIQPRRAVALLFGRGLVGRRSAADYGADPKTG